MNHLHDAHIDYQVIPKAPVLVDVSTLNEIQLLSSELLDSLQEEVARQLLDRGDEFIKRLVNAMMEPMPLPTWVKNSEILRRPSIGTSGLGEILCRKHKHQGWCHRMHVLEKYTRIAVNYHHARKKLRYEGADRYMSLVVLYGGLRSEARAKFYSSQCNCPGLGSNDEFMSTMDEDTFKTFIENHNC